MNTNMNLSGISNSTCFTGHTSLEAEELKRRRDAIAGRATDALAVFEALKGLEPTIENATDRGDYDETVARIVQDLNDWTTEAEALAVQFDDQETRKKMVKKLSNYVRREKIRMNRMKTLYDEDDEEGTKGLPLASFPGLEVGLREGIDTIPPTKESTPAGKMEGAQGVDAEKLAKQLETEKQKEQLKQQQHQQQLEQPGQRTTKFHNTRKHSKSASLVKTVSEGIADLLTPSKTKNGKRGVPPSARPKRNGEGEEAISDKKQLLDEGPIKINDELTQDTVDKEQPDDEVLVLEQRIPSDRRVLNARRSTTVDPREGLPRLNTPDELADADKDKKKELDDLKKQLEEANRRTKEIQQKWEETDKERLKAEKKAEEEKTMKNQEREKRERQENESAKHEEERRKQREQEQKRAAANKAAESEAKKLRRQIEHEKDQERVIKQKIESARNAKTNDDDDSDGFTRVTKYNSKRHSPPKFSTSSPVRHERAAATDSIRSKNSKPSATDGMAGERDLREGEGGEARGKKESVRNTSSLNRNREEEQEEDEEGDEEDEGEEEGEREREQRKAREEEFFKEAGLSPQEREEALKAEKKRTRKLSKEGRKKKRRTTCSWVTGGGADEETSSSSSEEEEENEPFFETRKLTSVEVRKQRLAKERVRESRPKTEEEKMGIEDGKDFSAFKVKFMYITNVDGLTDEDKLTELIEWTKGSAKRMIESNVGSTDPQAALKNAWAQLNIMFRAKVKSPLERLAPTFAKGQLIQTSTSSHFDVLADLQAAYNEAKRSGNHREFNKIEIVRATVAAKMDCYKFKFWEQEAERRKGRSASKVYFLNVINFIAQRAEMAALMGAIEQQKGKTSATCNATATNPTEAAPWNDTVKNSPKKTQQPLIEKPKCANCPSLQNHDTKHCHKLINMDEEKIDEKMKELGLCFSCAEPGHTARNCKKEKPVCAKCGNNHLTIFHKRNAKRQKIARENATRRAQQQDTRTQQQTNQQRPLMPLMPTTGRTATEAAAAATTTQNSTTNNFQTNSTGNALTSNPTSK